MAIALPLIAATPAAAATTFVVNRIGDQADLNLANAVCDVSSTAGNQCTLRAALQEANDTEGADIINFNITTTSKTITPATALPVIMEDVTINGFSQSGAAANTNATGNNAVLKIILDGANAPADTHGLVVDQDFSTIKGLVIQNFDGAGIVLDSYKTKVEGNIIGANPAGDTARPNRFGVLVTGAQNQIGGSSPAQRNVISGNELMGVSIFGVNADSNFVGGNFIGTRKGGGAALPNGLDGVRVTQGSSNQIGAIDGLRQVISGNGDSGIHVVTGENTRIFGNYIGTTVAGTADLGNGDHGIFVESSHGVSIGTTSAGSMNIISGNGLAGIDFSDVSESFIQNNRIGTNAAGTAALGNSGVGIFITNSEDNLIGGSSMAARNVISANLGGIQLGGTSNIVRMNRIGRSADASAALGNTQYGIEISGATNSIGGTNLEVNEVYNTTQGPGISIQGTNATGNVVSRNTISTNSGAGIRVRTGGNQILGNGLVGNGAEGVLVDSTSPATGAVKISSNVMFANGRLGINLARASDPASGVTANDAGDGDTGANRLQNFPVITSAIRAANGVTIVSGSLNSIASTQFTIELFVAAADPTGRGEGQSMLASQTITTNTSGNRAFTFQVANVAAGQQLTATATNVATSDTSEFSINQGVVQSQ